MLLHVWIVSGCFHTTVLKCRSVTQTIWSAKPGLSTSLPLRVKVYWPVLCKAVVIAGIIATAGPRLERYECN